MSGERWIRQEHYDDVRARLDEMSGRLRAAIVDAIGRHGIGSDEHVRLRWALTGQGPGAPSAKAIAAAWAADRPADLTQAQRFNALWEAVPGDPRNWWTGEEATAFEEQWERLALPPLTMGDGQGERYLWWCADAGRAAEMLGVDLGNDGGFTISKGEYEACIVQADEK